jgi:hypothetical protein
MAFLSLMTLTVGQNTQVMVIGGAQLPPSPNNIDSVEVFDVEKANLRCQRIQSFPYEAYGVLSAYVDGKIIACGGKTETQAKNDCFEFDLEGNSWIETAPLPVPDLSGAKSSVVGQKWFITGGGSPADSDQRSFVYENGLFSPGPELPEPKFGHCQVTLDERRVFITGGRGEFANATYILDLETQEWTRQEDIASQAVYVAGCGLVRGKNGDEVLVVVNDDSYIFSLTTFQWRFGVPLPRGLAFLTAAQFENDFAVVGGRIGNERSVDTISRFDAVNYEWVELDQTLAVARDYASAVVLPTNFIPCNEI